MSVPPPLKTTLAGGNGASKYLASALAQWPMSTMVQLNCLLYPHGVAASSCIYFLSRPKKRSTVAADGTSGVGKNIHSRVQTFTGGDMEFGMGLKVTQMLR